MTRTCAGRLHTLWDGEREGGNADRMETGCGREVRCRFYVYNKVSFLVFVTRTVIMWHAPLPFYMLYFPLWILTGALTLWLPLRTTVLMKWHSHTFPSNNDLPTCPISDCASFFKSKTVKISLSIPNISSFRPAYIIYCVTEIYFTCIIRIVLLLLSSWINHTHSIIPTAKSTARFVWTTL